MTASEPPPATPPAVEHGLSFGVEDYRQIPAARFRGAPGPATAEFDRLYRAAGFAGCLIERCTLAGWMATGYVNPEKGVRNLFPENRETPDN